MKALPCGNFHSIYMLNVKEIFILNGNKTFEKKCCVKTFVTDQ